MDGLAADTGTEHHDQAEPTGLLGPRCERAALRLDDRHVELWRGEVCDRLLDADAPWSAGQRLELDLEVVTRGGLVSLAVASPPGGPALARDQRRVAASRGPMMLGLTVVTAGRGELELEGRTVALEAGDVCLLSSPVRFRKRMGAGYGEAFLYCPLALAEAALGRAAPALEPGLAARSPTTAILADTLVSIRRQAARLAPDDWSPLVAAVLELAGAAFAPPRLAPEPSSAAEVAWRARIERYIDDHLAEPALTPPVVAAALKLSLRYLHKLFEPTGRSVAATIHARRLDRARVALLDRAHRLRSIAEISRAVGFRRADHFSRAFRARFGVSARDLRAAPRSQRLVLAGGERRQPGAQ